jgi:hypothetical protein
MITKDNKIIKKHILALTYEPKIDAVRSDRCTQTIRTLNPSKQKEPGDWIMFHGWEEEPYQSKWSWRTLYWKITEVFDICIKPDGIVIPEPEHYLDDELAEAIAKMDGFKDFPDMYQQFVKMYGDVFNGPFNDPFDHKFFQVIRWNSKKEMKTGEEERRL